MDAKKVFRNTQNHNLDSSDGQKRNSHHPVDGALFFLIQPEMPVLKRNGVFHNPTFQSIFILARKENQAGGDPLKILLIW
jgi:hypothetical protein